MVEKDVKALITLIDDPDAKIFEIVKKNLLDRGLSILDELESAWETAPSELSQSRLEDIIQEIQFKDSLANLEKWKNQENDNLLKGAFIIAKYQYPDLKYEDIDKQVEIIRKDAWMELNDNLTALEKVKILNHIIFDIHKYTKNSTNFYSPANSYINQVLETKKGNPVSLAIIYTSVAQKLHLPIYGVNLPKNFILAYKDEALGTDVFMDDFSDNILFYINPFNRGGVFGKREIDYFIKNQKLETQPSFYIPCSNVEIIRRLVLTLIHSYEKMGYEDKTDDLKKLFAILKD